MPTIEWEEKQRLIRAVQYHDYQRAGRRQGHRLVQWLTTSPHPTRPAHTHGA